MIPHALKSNLSLNLFLASTFLDFTGLESCVFIAFNSMSLGISFVDSVVLWSLHWAHLLLLCNSLHSLQLPNLAIVFSIVIFQYLQADSELFWLHWEPCCSLMEWKASCNLSSAPGIWFRCFDGCSLILFPCLELFPNDIFDFSFCTLPLSWEPEQSINKKHWTNHEAQSTPLSPCQPVLSLTLTLDSGAARRQQKEKKKKGRQKRWVGIRNSKWIPILEIAVCIHANFPDMWAVGTCWLSEPAFSSIQCLLYVTMSDCLWHSPTIAKNTKCNCQQRVAHCNANKRTRRSLCSFIPLLNNQWLPQQLLQVHRLLLMLSMFSCSSFPVSDSISFIATWSLWRTGALISRSRLPDSLSLSLSSLCLFLCWYKFLGYGELTNLTNNDLNAQNYDKEIRHRWRSHASLTSALNFQICFLLF